MSKRKRIRLALLANNHPVILFGYQTMEFQTRRKVGIIIAIRWPKGAMSVGATRCARARLFTRTWLARLAGRLGERPGEADDNEFVFKTLSKNRQGTPSKVLVT